MFTENNPEREGEKGIDPDNTYRVWRTRDGNWAYFSLARPPKHGWPKKYTEVALSPAEARFMWTEWPKGSPDRHDRHVAFLLATEDERAALMAGTVESQDAAQRQDTGEEDLDPDKYIGLVVDAITDSARDLLDYLKADISRLCKPDEFRAVHVSEWLATYDDDWGFHPDLVEQALSQLERQSVLCGLRQGSDRLYRFDQTAIDRHYKD